MHLSQRVSEMLPNICPNLSQNVNYISIVENINFLFNDDDGVNELDINALRVLVKNQNIDVVLIDSIIGLIMGNGISI